MSIFSKVWKTVTNPVKKVVGKVSDVLGEDVMKAIAIAGVAYGGYSLYSAYAASSAAAAGTSAAGAASGTAATGAAATSGTTIAAGTTTTAAKLAATGLEIGGETAISTTSKILGYAKTAGTVVNVASSGANLLSSISASKEQEETASKIKEAEASATANRTAELWTLRRQLTQNVRGGKAKTTGSGATNTNSELGFNLG